MVNIPISRELIREITDSLGFPHPSRSSIREIVGLVNKIEEKTGISFVRMEMGVPGLKAPDIAIKAEIEALNNGVASVYPPIEGVAGLKNETSRFLKLFLDIDMHPSGCVPTCGSLQGSMAVFLTVNRSDPERKGTLFIDPGFPVHKQQCMMLGQELVSFDIYEHRGRKLGVKLESMLENGKISSILYSNPNNPAWFCLSEEELQIIAKIANKYDVIILEDLAYLGMDFRKDISTPGKEPFQSTVAKYTDNYILLMSASKMFSYAGQRIAMVAVPQNVYQRKYPALKRYYNTDTLGHAIVYGALYALSAGAPHSAQKAVEAILKATNDGEYSLTSEISEYGRRANRIKKIFTDNGFHIVYDKDIDVKIGDGFYFTVAYNGMNGGELLNELLHYGISAVTLSNTGSERQEGLRACVSLTGEEMMPWLEERLKHFRKDHI